MLSHELDEGGEKGRRRRKKKRKGKKREGRGGGIRGGREEEDHGGGGGSGEGRNQQIGVLAFFFPLGATARSEGKYKRTPFS